MPGHDLTHSAISSISPKNASWNWWANGPPLEVIDSSEVCLGIGASLATLSVSVLAASGSSGNPLGPKLNPCMAIRTSVENPPRRNATRHIMMSFLRGTSFIEIFWHNDRVEAPAVGSSNSTCGVIAGCLARLVLLWIFWCSTLPCDDPKDDSADDAS